MGVQRPWGSSAHPAVLSQEASLIDEMLFIKSLRHSSGFTLHDNRGSAG